jgi:hypothetical protein
VNGRRDGYFRIWHEESTNIAQIRIVL